MFSHRVKQIAQYQDGRLELHEVPTPIAPPGGVLVQTTHSVISVGTERMKVEQAKMNLLQKARARPDQVKKVLETARNLGWKSALEKVRNRLETPTPLGYSASGIIVEVHPENRRYRVGQRVACAGAECAFHAEFLALPDMLTSLLPESVNGEQGAYTTLCAIALQAVRQLDPKLGERVLVMGQGLVGLLVTQILVSNGCRVMAVDVSESKRSPSERMGAERVVILATQDLKSEVADWTEDFGVDGVVVCTATQSNTPIEQAAESLRDRGRLVDVGITKMDLPWKTFYEKELDVRFSRSYGPGRYDPGYEWGGRDYPIGYVRWTEQRNMDACLHLMANGQLTPERLTTLRAPFLDSLGVYETLAGAGHQHVGVVLSYSHSGNGGANSTVQPHQSSVTSCSTTGRETGGADVLQTPVAAVDAIGAGNFARTMLLPHLKEKVRLGLVVNQTALSAEHVRSKFGFESSGVDERVAWTAPGNRGALIATRHHLHAPMVLQALAVHRHVFVEKPLCLNRTELHAISNALIQSQGSLQVGFNRRFAPASIVLRDRLSRIAGPKVITYRVHAGRLDPSHWYANVDESGGRILGEACHFLDYFCFLLGSTPLEVIAVPVGKIAGRLPFSDSVGVMVRFADGSVAHLSYLAEADPAFPKETIQVSGEGIVAEIENFQRFRLLHMGKREEHRYSSKGHKEQMEAWVDFLLAKKPHPLALSQITQSMSLTFATLESLQRGCPIQVVTA